MRRSSSVSKESTLPIKVELTDNETIESGAVPLAKEPPASISIDKVVGNFKQNSAPAKCKPDIAAKITLKPVVKPNTNAAKPTTGPPPPKSNAAVNKTVQTPPAHNKANINRSSLAAKIPVAKHPNKPVVVRRAVADEEEDLDPAMYLDPTITITLINNDHENKKGGVATKSVGDISSSDLQVVRLYFHFVGRFRLTTF